jgi:predicted nucleotidyltransferase
VELTAEGVLEALSQHRAELRALGVRRLGLFGSMARGEARDDSDLDFAADFDDLTYDAIWRSRSF